MTLAPTALAGCKIGLLAVAGSAAFFISDWRLLAAALTACIALAACLRVSWRRAVSWGSAFVLLLVLLGQGLAGNWSGGVSAVLRIAALVLLAAIVTETTRSSDMTEAIAAGLRPLRRLGLDPDGLALALALTVRLLPLIASEASLVRDAQRARGLERSPLALFVPLIVRVLKLADQLAEAIEARSG